ncbi:MAG: hypothetical protein K6B52_03140 [Clostridiales bacterium]|nr:hypothetical protein [Clostridiales bacterium]
MKKAVIISLLFLITCSAFGCSMSDKIAFNDSDYKEKISKMQQKEEKESVKHSQKLAESVNKLEAKIGKTEKNVKLVSKTIVNTCTVYEVIWFNKDAIADYKMTYKYFNDKMSYNLANEAGDIDDDKLTDHDDDLMMLTYKNKKISEISFDDYYQLRSSSNQYTVVE